MSSTPGSCSSIWLFLCWELGRLSFHKFLAARPPEWQALEAGLLVPHTYPTLFQDSWKGNHQIHGEIPMILFCCGICLDELIWYSISSDLLSLLRDGSSRWSNPTRSPERLHLIISDSVQGLGRDGLQLPPIDVPVWSLEPRELGLFTTFPQFPHVQQMFSWVRLHLQFIHLPLFPFHYNLLQSAEPWGSSERLCSENGQRDSKRSSVQNIVATLKNDSKKAPKPSSFGKGNACFVRCCSWMDIPPRWWTFYAWPLLGRELMGRHCKGC